MIQEEIIFDNISEKIKSMAAVIFCAGIMAALYFAAAAFFGGLGGEMFFIGLAVLIGSLTLSYCVYGFGAIVEKICGEQDKPYAK